MADTEAPSPVEAGIMPNYLSLIFDFVGTNNILHLEKQSDSDVNGPTQTRIRFDIRD